MRPLFSMFLALVLAFATVGVQDASADIIYDGKRPKPRPKPKLKPKPKPEVRADAGGDAEDEVDMARDLGAAGDGAAESPESSAAPTAQDDAAPEEAVPTEAAGEETSAPSGEVEKAQKGEGQTSSGKGCAHVERTEVPLASLLGGVVLLGLLRRREREGA